MDLKKLADSWTLPEKPRLTQKQIALRLPLVVAAKISALCEVFPHKTKTEIIGDMLMSTLDNIENCLPKKAAHEISLKDDFMLYANNPRGLDPDDVVAVFEDVGKRGDYLRAAEKHLRLLEAKAGVDVPTKLPSPYLYFYGEGDLEGETEEDLKKKEGWHFIGKPSSQP